MGKKERAAALTQRRNAKAIIKNLRFTRRFLASHPFDEATFEYINGKDRGIEALVGHNILFKLLGDTEKLALHKEILAKLDESEKTAFDQLRSSTVAYFKDLADLIAKAPKKVTPKDLTYFDSNKEAVVEAFNATIVPADGLDCERSMSALEKLDIIAKDIEETTPDIEHEFDEDEVKEEEHDHDDGSYGDQTGDDIPPAEDDDDDDQYDEGNGSEDAIDDEITLPDEDQNVDEPEPQPPAEPPAPAPTEPAPEEPVPPVTAKVSWVDEFNHYIDIAKNFVAKEDFALNLVGFTPKKASYILSKYNTTMTRYKAALEKLYAVVDPVTCTADSLLRGKIKTFKRIDKIISLAVKFEEIQTPLDKSLESLLTASRNMMRAATYDPTLG